MVCRRGPSGSVAKKLEAVRVAARLEFPTADIDAMLTEIESGYRTDYEFVILVGSSFCPFRIKNL